MQSENALDPITIADSSVADGPARDESTPGLTGQVRRAIFWRTGTQILSQIISWTVTLIVIRILNPADYGLYAMAQVMMTFLDFLNGYGFASALIQQKEVTRHAIRQALGLQILMNAMMAAMQFAAAPVIADYYGQPVVADILHVLCFIYLFTPFILVPEVLLAKTLDFKKQAIVGLSAAAVGALVALILATRGFGVWTLVFAPLSINCTRAIGLSIAARLRPWPSFDFRGAGHIVNFGLLLMFSHLFWVIQSQSDVFIAGRLFDPHDIGLYAESLFLTQLVMSKFVPALNQVAFPAYARLQDDRDALAQGFLNAVRLVTLVTAPIFIGIAASAAPLVEILFGHKWIGMVPMMQMLGLATPFMTVQILFPPVNNAIGRPDLTMKASLTGALSFPIAFFIGSRFGIHGLAAAWLLCAPLLLLATAHIAARGNGIAAMRVLRAAAPAIGTALLMGAIVHLLGRVIPPSLPMAVQLAALVGAGALSYGALSFLLQRQSLLYAWNLLRPTRR